MYASVEVDGVLYNADKTLEFSEIPELQGVLGSYYDSDGRYTIFNASSTTHDVVMSVTPEQGTYTDSFRAGNMNESAHRLPNGDFAFTLTPAP